MEVCVPYSTSAGEVIRTNSGSSADPLEPSRCNSKVISVNDLETCVTQYLNIEDIEISTGECNSSPGKSIVNLLREDGHGDAHKSKARNPSSRQCISKCASSSPPGESNPSLDGSLDGKKKLENTPDFMNQGYSESRSTPSPLKLVSALKGSREKQGKAPKNLSVTWAPDVYDPIPTSVSHVPSNKNYRYRSDSKKYGKNKQKNGGKSSRGKSKDKKQPRKNSGSTKTFKPRPDDSGAFDFCSHSADIADFNVVGPDPDPFCGSSFLKQSVSKLHFTAAEAT